MNDVQRQWNWFTRMWYLVGQHAAVGCRSQHTVYCQRCGQEYDSYGSPDSMQGHDICAWIGFVTSASAPTGRWELRAGYGSDYDMKVFWFIDAFPTQPVDGICDYCIMRMLAAGVIIDSGLEGSP